MLTVAIQIVDEQVADAVKKSNERLNETASNIKSSMTTAAENAEKGFKEIRGHIQADIDNNILTILDGKDADHSD